MKKYSDAEILESISATLKGDTYAFGKIVEQYQNTVFRICLSYLSDREEAEDAAQEVFLRIYKSLAGFRLGKSFTPWVYAIALNWVKSRRSVLKRLADTKRKLILVDEPAAETPEIITDKEMQKKALQDAVKSLPAPLKDVVVLYYLEDVSVDDIAEALGIGKENVKSRLFRARKKLKEILEKDATKQEK